MAAEAAAQAAATAHSRVRTLRAFPFPPEHAAATVTLTWLEDDGVTLGSSDRMVISCELYCTPQTLRLSARVTLHGDGRGWRPAFRTIEVRLPARSGAEATRHRAGVLD